MARIGYARVTTDQDLHIQTERLAAEGLKCSHFFDHPERELSGEHVKVADFSVAQCGTCPPLPWSTSAPPLSNAAGAKTYAHPKMFKTGVLTKVSP